MSEAKEAKRMDAKLVKNSGRNFHKSDILKGKNVIDLKEIRKSFTINEKVWAKVCDDAASYGSEYTPVLLLKFASGVRLVVVAYEDSGID